MDVSALLPRHLATHLERVLGQEHTLHVAEDWDDLEAEIRHRIVDLVVADPMMRGSNAVAALEGIRRGYPSLPIVLYTALAASSIQALVRLARSGIEHVVLHRFDDDPRRFLELLEGIPAHALGERMLRELSAELAGMPVMVGRAVELMFRSPERFGSTQALADAAGMNLRTLYRNLEPVGFFSPRTLVVAAQLVRVFAYLGDPGRSIKDVAAKTGYRTPWKLSQQMREMTGRPTEQARRDLDGEEFVALLAQQVRRRRNER